MRIELLDGELSIRPAGAAVVRAVETGVIIDFGPADGPPLSRLRLTSGEATQLSAALKSVASGKHEEIILVEE